MNARRPPRQQGVRLVAYDISDPKRLARAETICLDYGTRIQKSLFECILDEAAFRDMWEKLQSAIDAKTDTVVAFPVCRACLRRSVSAGRPPPRPSAQGYIF